MEKRHPQFSLNQPNFLRQLPFPIFRENLTQPLHPSANFRSPDLILEGGSTLETVDITVETHSELWINKKLVKG